MDAKQACDKLNGFNFQNRYLVGMSKPPFLAILSHVCCHTYEDALLILLQSSTISLRKWQNPKRILPSDRKISKNSNASMASSDAADSGLLHFRD